jgi:hypothetical protein
VVGEHLRRLHFDLDGLMLDFHRTTFLRTWGLLFRQLAMRQLVLLLVLLDLVGEVVDDLYAAVAPL